MRGNKSGVYFESNRIDRFKWNCFQANYGSGAAFAIEKGGTGFAIIIAGFMIAGLFGACFILRAIVESATRHN